MELFSNNLSNEHLPYIHFRQCFFQTANLSARTSSSILKLRLHFLRIVLYAEFMHICGRISFVQGRSCALKTLRNHKYFVENRAWSTCKPLKKIKKKHSKFSCLDCQIFKKATLDSLKCFYIEF